jgi:hypothetical protein
MVPAVVNFVVCFVLDTALMLLCNVVQQEMVYHMSSICTLHIFIPAQLNMLRPVQSQGIQFIYAFCLGGCLPIRACGHAGALMS